jgi:putative DNA primase/helicase
VAIWESAGPADPSHPYLTAKNIPPIRIRQQSGCLMVPLWNLYGKLAGIQCISRSGRKWFYKGSKPSGAFHLLGHPGHVLLIVEGYADGAAIHASSDLPVVIAFGAGNLPVVGMALRSLYPYAHLIFVADDDVEATSNIGLKKATEAAEACGGSVILPSELMEEINNGC